MANKMLIDAAHPEETRVVVLRGNRVEEFDFESAHRRQLRGNIYLAKVTRVEPSLQAAFVDYGGNRHGFLAFSEIHPDYYQIPVADRQALIEEEKRAQRAAEDEAERRMSRRPRRAAAAGAKAPARVSRLAREPEPKSEETLLDAEAEAAFVGDAQPENGGAETASEAHSSTEAGEREAASHQSLDRDAADLWPSPGRSSDEGEASGEDISRADERAFDTDEPDSRAAGGEGASEAQEPPTAGDGDNGQIVESEEEDVVESVGGADALEEVAERVPRLRRQYKIQEVIKRRQIMLVQVVKEERGTKGAALTSYLSLAGRYSVLMPNTARGGGISRKITDPEDRKRLKGIAQELEVPEGMGVILRTAGATRTKTEIKRDFEYLLRVWETVRDLTLKSTAPTLVYEEGSLVKRTIRDLYTKDIDEVNVAGEQAYREAKDFMAMLMPSHAKNVKLYRDSQPLFSRHGIESQLDAMFSPVVQLKSGGYIVLNQTEALVSIDVNSGRATREYHIEDTALKTNLEASDEVARQLRLRDLAGLIVIDFIDMDEKRNNRAVERRLKDALKNDRARIQVGRISHFGLLEMSRQRIRASVLESSTEKCAHCGGSGHVRSISSVALQLLRVIEEALLRGATNNLIIRTRADIALYLLNQKRGHLRDLEERFQITVTVDADATIGGQQPFVVEKGELVHSPEQARIIAAQRAARPAAEEEEEEEEAKGEEIEAATEAEETAARAEVAAESERPRRRRRRGRGGREEREPATFTHETVAEHVVAHEEDHEQPPAGAEPPREEARETAAEAESRRRRRRGRRGGRRTRRGREGEAAPERATAPEELEEAQYPAIEPEVAAAVADFGGPPVEPAAEPEPAGSQEAPPPHPEHPEPSRRRSTVREPAALPIEGSAPLPPVPAASEAADASGVAEEADKPRRTGWWAKRLIGDNH